MPSFVPYSISPSPSPPSIHPALLWFYNNLAMPFDFAAAGQKSHIQIGGRRRSSDRGVADNDLIQSEFDYFIMTKTAGDGITELYKCREYAAATLE